MNGKCCVFQPFDGGGPFDKRYRDVIAVAIREAGLESYRVDQDPSVVIPVETLHDEIRASAICLADISTDNPNVLYELGYAIASGKDVVLISIAARDTKFPFDLQHRGIIQYKTDAPGDFARLKDDIVAKVRALVAKSDRVASIVAASPMKSTQGLQPHESTALALIMANRESAGAPVEYWRIRQDMEKAGFTALATGLALTNLERHWYISHDDGRGLDGEPMTLYKLADDGEEWLLQNEGELELRRETRPPADDDSPF